MICSASIAPSGQYDADSAYCPVGAIRLRAPPIAPGGAIRLRAPPIAPVGAIRLRAAPIAPARGQYGSAPANGGHGGSVPRCE